MATINTEACVTCLPLFAVSDALPLMMSDNPAGTDKKILLNWLDKAFQYYVVTSLQPHKEGMVCLVV